MGLGSTLRPVAISVLQYAKRTALTGWLRRLLGAQRYLAVRSFLGRYVKSLLTGRGIQLRRFEERKFDRFAPGVQKDIGPLICGGEMYDTFDDLLGEKGRECCDIVVCCAFLGRYGILEAAVKELCTSASRQLTAVCLVGSSREDKDFLLRLTGRYPRVVGLLAGNRPIGRKWQTAVDLARAIYEFELLAITGSDDVLPTELLSTILKRHRVHQKNDNSGTLTPGLYATMQWMALSASTGPTMSPNLVKLNYKTFGLQIPLGAGRFYSRKMIDRCDGNIFDPKLNVLLDDKGFYQTVALGFGVDYYTVNDGVVLSVKGNWSQLNAFDKILSASTIDVTDSAFDGASLLSQQLTELSLRELVETALRTP